MARSLDSSVAVALALTCTIWASQVISNLYVLFTHRYGAPRSWECAKAIHTRTCSEANNNPVNLLILTVDAERVTFQNTLWTSVIKHH